MAENQYESRSRQNRVVELTKQYMSYCCWPSSILVFYLHNVGGRDRLYQKMIKTEGAQFLRRAKELKNCIHRLTSDSWDE